MELVQFCYNPHNKDDVITVCDADIASYLSGEHQTLHICFLEDLPRVPMTGFASCDYDDVWKIDIRQFEDFYSPLHFHRYKVPRWLKGGVVKGDTVQVEIRFKANVLYFRLGKNRKDWTRTLCTKFDPAIKIVFVVESAKENFCVIRDELYLDYILCGPPRSRLYCRCCEYYRDKTAVAVYNSQLAAAAQLSVKLSSTINKQFAAVNPRPSTVTRVFYTSGTYGLQESTKQADR